MAALPEVGIIPARAGSTSPRATRAADGPDHPRSRGVYLQAGQARITGEGSSPLARGLRQGDRLGGRLPRIIPARAGSTTGFPRYWRGPPDHPRSRGVYPGVEPVSAAIWGSSPLARGLLAG